MAHNLPRSKQRKKEKAPAAAAIQIRGIELSKNLHPSTQDRMFEGFRQGSLLGFGCYGSVWSFSYPQPTVPEDIAQKHRAKLTVFHNLLQECGSPVEKIRFILKVSGFESDKHEQLVDTWKREVFFLKYLRETGLVPSLLMSEHIGETATTATTDQKKGLQLMERFTGNLKELGAQQSKWFQNASKRALTYTYAQLLQIFDLAQRLDDLGIVHGDFKLSNLLYRLLGDAKNPTDEPRYDFRVADFGFAGFANVPSLKAHIKPEERYEPLIGFLHLYGPVSARIRSVITDLNRPTSGIPWFRLKSPIPKPLLSYFNRLSLYVSMIECEEIYIAAPQRSTYVRLTQEFMMEHLFTNLKTDPELLLTLNQYLPGLSRRSIPKKIFCEKRYVQYRKQRDRVRAKQRRETKK